MAVRIRNLLASGPVVVPLNTGATVRLSPGQVSPDLPDVEVAGNGKVEKLRRLGLIDVQPAEQGAGATAGTGEPEAAEDTGARRSARKRSETSR